MQIKIRDFEIVAKRLNRSRIVRRYYVKITWPSAPARIVPTATYIWGRRVKINCGAAAYMLDANHNHQWGVNVMLYHDGIDVDGIRLELYAPGDSKYSAYPEEA